MGNLWLYMRKAGSVLATKDDFSVDLILHDFSASLLVEFAEKIVRSYYSGNMSAAIKDLMQKTVSEEGLVLTHLKPNDVSNSIQNVKREH